MRKQLKILAVAVLGMRAVTANKPEEEGLVIDATYEFMWPLVSMTLLKVIDKNGTVFFHEGQADGNLGYFRGLDRNTGAIIRTISRRAPRENIGALFLRISFATIRRICATSC